MSAWQGADGPAPTPEQLAAYADCELDGRPEAEGLCRRIEAWLARHPEAAADLQAQRALERLWQATTPAEPAESAWADVLARLEDIPLSPAAGPARSARLRARAAWAAVLLGASAAALWLALVLLRPAEERQVVRKGPPAPGPRLPAVRGELVPEAVEPFPVATAD